MSWSVYRQILLSKSSFKRLIFALLEQLNTNIQGISRCILLPSWQISWVNDEEVRGLHMG